MGFLLEPGVAIYVSLAVALAVWIGIFAFLWRLDRQTRELRRRLEQEPGPQEPAPRAAVRARSGPSKAPVAMNDEV